MKERKRAAGYNLKEMFSPLRCGKSRRRWPNAVYSKLDVVKSNNNPNTRNIYIKNKDSVPK